MTSEEQKNLCKERRKNRKNNIHFKEKEANRKQMTRKKQTKQHLAKHADKTEEYRVRKAKLKDERG